MTTTFFRLLKDSDKAAALERVVADYRAGTPDGERTFTVDPEAFRKVPNTPFAYWVDDSIRELFVKLPPFESEGRTVKQGLATADDFRFVRAWWEVDAERRLDPGLAGAPDWRDNLEAFQQWCRTRTHHGKYWVPFAKGGEYSPYYSDIHLVVNWKNEGEEIKGFVDPKTGKQYSRPQNTDYYFRPGVTWPERTTSGFGLQILVPGVVFSHVGELYWGPNFENIAASAYVSNTRLMAYVIEVLIGSGDSTVSGSAARHYTTGLVARLPALHDQLEKSINESGAARRVLMTARYWAEQDPTQLFFNPQSTTMPSINTCVWNEYRRFIERYSDCTSDLAELDRLVLKAHVADARFPAVLDNEEGPDVFSFDNRRLSETERELFSGWSSMSVDRFVDEIVDTFGRNRWTTKKSYMISRVHELAAAVLRVNPLSILNEQIEHRIVPRESLERIVRALFESFAGSAFGRWDVRILLSESSVIDEDLFEFLPVVPAPSLVSPNGLPATSGNIVSEEWLRARGDVNSLPVGVEREFIDDLEYPIPVPWDGILVDDPDHPADIVARVRGVLGVLHGDDAEKVERELVEELGVGELREFIGSPSGFFEAHLKTYSKSRRKAPIYWPLSTASGGYTVWIYYPRLGADTLFTVIDKYLQPKIAVVERELAELSVDGSRSRSRQKRFDLLTRDIGELRQFADEIKRITNLPYTPDHDDGVPICAAPLWQLFRHSGWSSYCRDIWEKLEAGSFDWSHLAFAIWPDRVRAKAAGDRSIAIAHGI